MTPNYSRYEFEGYTTRFKVEFNTNGNENNIDIYSDSDSVKDLLYFIHCNLKNKHTKFSLIHTASKRQDELTTQFINETLHLI